MHLPAAPQYPGVPHPAAAPHATAPQHPAPASGAPAPPTAHPTAYPTPASPLFPGHLAYRAQAREGNPLGVTAFVIAVATLAVNLFGAVARPLVYSGDGGFEFMLALDNGIGILSFFTYVVALVLALVAVRRSSARMLAGIAIGVAGAGAIGLAFTGLTIALYQYY
ncbi:hypothetical protein D514_0105295 [Microbacterium sp. UCD-TDU]|nr:hypothetical protein D514_0105295 [Microbacterium sp. UCD-TDU]